MAKLNSGTRIYGNLTVDTWANISGIYLGSGGASNGLFWAANNTAISFSGGSGTPGGSNTQLQYNNSGAFAGAANFIYSSASGNVAIGTTTTSTSTTTGALVVTGGAGIGGNLYVGTNLVVTGNLTINGSTNTINNTVYETTEYVQTIDATTVRAVTIGNSGATLTGTLSTAAQTNITSVGNLTTLSTAGTTTSWGNIVAASGTASTSNTTGALVVSGGAGIAGNLFVGGNLILANAVTANSAVIGTTGTYNNTALVLQPQGNIDLSTNTVNLSTGGTVTGVTETGIGYNYTTSGPTLSITPPTTAGGVQATANVSMKVYVSNGPTLVSGGSGYAANNVLTLVGGTSTTAAQITVLTVDGSGSILTFSVANAGNYTTIPGSNPVSTTVSPTGGTGATFNVYWRTNLYTIINAGSGYVEQPTITFSGGNGTAGTAYATVGSTTSIKGLGYQLNLGTSSGTGFAVSDAGANAAYWWQAIGGGSNGILRSSGSSASGLIQSQGTGSIYIQTNSGAQNQFSVTHTASAVNYLSATGATTGGNPVLSTQGSDSNIGFTIKAKGGGSSVLQGDGGVYFQNNGYNNQFAVTNTASAVNYLQATGGPTGNVVTLSAQGTDTSASILLQPKGTTSNLAVVANGSVVLSSGTGAISAIRYNALGSGYGTQPTVTISAPTTPGGVTATANATIFFGGATIVSGGTGYSVGDVLTVQGGSYTSQGQIIVTGNSSGVITSVTYTNGGQYYSFPANAVSVTGGTGSSATFNLLPGGVNGFNVLTAGSGYIEPPAVTVSGGGGSGATAIARVGSVPQVKSLTSSLDFYTSNGQILRLTDSTNLAVNYWQLSSSASGVQVGMAAIGGDTNIGTNFTTKGTSGHVFSTNAYGSVALVLSHTASAVNYVQATGAATGGSPTISAQGSDTYIALNLQSKSAPLVLSTRSTGTSFAVLDAGSASTNYLTVFGPRISGTGAILGASGTDANVAIVVQPKNYGNIDLNANAVVLTNGTGSITSITQTATGNLYLAAPTVTISTPQTQNGIQATANANIGVVFISNIQSAGTGYSVGNILTMVGNASTFSNATFTVTAVGNAVGGTGNVTALAITTSGSYNIANANPVTFTLAGTGAGSGLQVNVTYGVNTPVITNAGSGYVEQPTITISGGTGTANATAYATVGSPTNITGLGANLSITLPQGEVIKVVTSPVIQGVQSGNITNANLGVGITANSMSATALTGNAIAAGGVGIVGNVYGTSRIGFTWVANSSSAAYTVFNPGINSIDTYFG
jgi:hypothetical protein